jgi:hypothetical protein
MTSSIREILTSVACCLLKGSISQKPLTSACDLIPVEGPNDLFQEGDVDI